jgi:hypothetical protein
VPYSYPYSCTCHNNRMGLSMPSCFLTCAHHASYGLPLIDDRVAWKRALGKISRSMASFTLSECWHLETTILHQSC